ncbi:hypothetical protein Calab_2620 [Caldithrix abyssi DSM 13497]|uniref:Chemotaxis phosphatase CheX n=1 Tax=Caldithrix abyssi DSM 13497 TaxID=880073 RepID=H1XPB5_CALAY|nr:chemotaxis protein CheX [Caldithrix abyssi]APF18203.1 Chemotaxis phosphatase CheX [Caldithrix abyssi DSM 13497]EHO42230.1 hypothetical protein Calab_2620 [Caldithrix abyssi DSM 13497]
MRQETVEMALEKAIAEASEHLFFQELMEVRMQRPAESFSPGDYLVLIKVSEPLKGILVLIYERHFAPQLVTEVIGDIVDDDNAVTDGLKEISNTIAGNLMANMVPDTPFKIGLPSCCHIFHVNDLPVEYVLNFYFDETRIGAFWIME